MIRRGGSANQLQMIPYEQMELDDGWREWENTKQELVSVKRQLADKDAVIMQLKTATRRLQEMLRKKDKDLQAAFAILRSPQDDKTTKTRKQELIDRLVSEWIQRATTSEALAEERRQELDRLKHSSKFLRFQELEIEINECYTEIERLRAKLEMTRVFSPTSTTRKAKKLSMSVTATDAGSLRKKSRIGLVKKDGRAAAKGSVSCSESRKISTQSDSGQVRVVPIAKSKHREGFVSKTRRRALEAEYYKQVRLAQLEAECELEENMHIRAAREAQKMAQQERETEFTINAATSEQDNSGAAVESNDTTKMLSEETAKKSNANDDRKALERLDAVSAGPDLKKVSSRTLEIEVDNTGPSTQVEEEGLVQHSVSVQLNVSKEPALTPIVVDSEDKCYQKVVQEGENEQMCSQQRAYDNDNFHASGDANPVLSGVWNVDPNPLNTHQLDDMENDGSKVNQQSVINANGDENTESVVWNVDPEPSNTEADSYENDAQRGVQSTDLQVVDAQARMDDMPSLNEDAMHDTAKDSIPSEGNNTNGVWNFDPNFAVHEQVKGQNDCEPAQEDDSTIAESIGENKIWNLDPKPSPVSESNDTAVHHFDGQATPDVVTEKEHLLVLDKAETRREDAVDTLNEGQLSAVASKSAKLNPSETIDDKDPPTESKSGQSAWNLDPNPVQLSSLSTNELLSENAENERHAQNGDSSAPDAAELSIDDANSQTESTHDTEASMHEAWRLDPTTLPDDKAHDETVYGNLVSPSGDAMELNDETAALTIKHESVEARSSVDKHTDDDSERCGYDKDKDDWDELPSSIQLLPESIDKGSAEVET